MNFLTFCIAIGATAVLLLNVKCTLDASKPEAILAESIRQEKCRKPVKVTETPDGVELWRYQTKCNAHQENVVYFSKSGTNRTYSERHGKVTKEYTQTTPNGEKQ